MAACLRVLAAPALMLVMAQPAAAQVFVSGGAFANVLRFGNVSSESPSVSSEDLSGTSTGALIGVGGVFGAHAVVQVEIALPTNIHTDIPPSRTLYPVPPPTTTVSRSADYRTRQVSILGGYQTGRKHRVRAAVLGGLMFVEEDVRTLTKYSSPVPNPYNLDSDYTYRYKRLAPVFGFDLVCAITRHLDVVPQIRMYRTGTNYGLIGLWPGVSGRWTF